MRVHGAVKSLIQGVSQQPTQTRFPGQCTLQENMSSNPVTGLGRRPPIEYMADLITTTAVPEFLEVSFGDLKYRCVITPELVRVYNPEDGSLVQDITVPDDVQDYLSQGDLCALSVNNTAYIASRNVYTRMLPGLKEYSGKASIVSVLGGQYGRTFTVTVTWGALSAASSFTTNNGGTTTDILTIKTTKIATELQLALQANTTNSFNTLFTVARIEDVLHISSATIPDFNVTVSDDEGGTLIKACNNQVGSLGELPRYAPNGYYAKVSGSGGSAADDYYVSFYVSEPTDTFESVGYFSTDSSGRLCKDAVPITYNSGYVYPRGTYISVLIGFTYYVSLVDIGSTGYLGVINVKTGGNVYDLTGTKVYWRKADSQFVSKDSGVTWGAGTVNTNVSLVSFPATIYRNSSGYLTLKDGQYCKDSTGTTLVLTSYTTGTFGKAGVWYEDVAPGLVYKIDPSSMPVGLIRDELSGELSLQVLDWAERGCGDDNTNPVPSFIDKKINDISFFQGRLVLVAGKATIMSRPSSSTSSSTLVNFWRETAVQETDSDVIDIESTYEGAGDMLRCVPHNRDLIVFADKAQFIVLGRNALTPSNASLILTTTFEADLGAKPIGAGRNVFFGIQYGQYIGVREFFTMDSIDANDSRPITAHVSKYMTGTLRSLIGSSNYDVLLVLTDTTNAYVYEYLWGDQGKVQSSWSTWVFPWVPVTGWMQGSNLYFVRHLGEVYSLYKIALDIQDDTGLSYKVHLDNRKEVSMVDGVIQIPDYTESLVFIRGDGCDTAGMRVLPKTAVEDAGVYTVDFDNPTDSGTIIYGIPYTSRYKPSMPQVKDQDGVSIGTGKFRVAQFIFNCTKSSKLKYVITSVFRDPMYGEISGRFTNDPRTVLGEEVIQDRQFILPFRDDIKNAELEVYTDSHTPLTFTNMEYKGQYMNTGERLSQGK